MSGGKQSPRDKMIGMMYLVLTALLALQVSNAVLDKFVFIDEALITAANETKVKNDKTVNSIKAEVEKKGNRTADVKALKRAEEVREITHRVLTHLDSLREKFVEITGGRDPETNQLIGIKDFDIVSNYMINQQKGELLKEELNGYAEKLSELAGEEFPALARDAKDIDLAKNDPNQNMKDFSEYYFEHTPTAAGMATISHLESEVLRYEQKALEDIAELVGAKDVSFDQIVPLVRPKSNIVANGAKFEADLFLAASSSSISPKFMYNKNEIKQSTTENGIKFGVIEFTARASSFDPKTLLANASFEAEIELNDSVYTIKHNYQVVKPTVQYNSAAASALYLNCGNELDIQVPALGTSYSPSFSSAEASIVKGSKTGLVTIIPTGRSKVKLRVSNGGSPLDTKTFSVKKPPLPNYTFKIRGKDVDFKNGAKATAVRSMDIKAEAEENFAREVPKDARYRIREMEVILARGTRAIIRQKFKTEKLNLSQYASQARPGDRLVIEIKRTTRRTYQGKDEKVTTRNEIYTIPLN